MIRLENWYITSDINNGYQAPESVAMRLCGNVYGHPVKRHVDGKLITTSAISDVNGTRVTTRSGNEYFLGTPSAEYVEWCKTNNKHVPTLDEPIKLHTQFREEWSK